MPVMRDGDRANDRTRSVTGTVRGAVEWLLRQRRTDQAPRLSEQPSEALSDLKILVTADEAYREFERLVLSAKESLTAGFRIFDPDTRLLSDAARQVGDTWEDLIADALARGVRIQIILSDFDPVFAPSLHRRSWMSQRRLTERAAAEGCAERLEVDVHMHPSRSGYPIRLAAARTARRRLRDMARWINDQGELRREEYLRDVPGLDGMLVRDETGKVSLAKGVIPPMRPISHHQKLAVIDRKALYVGGLDLDNRRQDDKSHDQAGPRTWADVQLSFTGPAAASAEDHLLAFRDEVAGKRVPAASRDGLLRTLSVRRTGLGALGLGPAPAVHELVDRTAEGVAGATQLIYLETQFLRDLHLCRDLARRGQSIRDLGLIVCLPAAPEELAFEGAQGMDMRFGEHLQSRCVEILSRAFGDRVSFVSPAQPRGMAPDGTRGVLCGAPIVYVHSKVSIFDDRLALVSSANLNGRSARWDTELGVALTDAAQVKRLRSRVMNHWLPEDPAPELLNPATAAQAWGRLAEANRKRQPAEREGFLLPYPASAPRKFGRPLPGVTQDIM
ncbi:phospholipase D family protein [Roseisalinus antarcticus]|uniref:Phospholipase D n=1 Tax=Roseisalinus antarcticus TaxID=254357 RepID=A0A1Y5U1Q6_9RHOB|nr:phospholipase D-like domain-containing protein [Roseisalinus antarcticus]SLN76900.1 cardiolipin synthetase [Roseisalinus antarcticus]